MDLNICRLCMGEKFLTNIYQIDGEVRLDTKISYCLDVKLHPKDSYPVMICKQCKRKVQKFYKFKQNCLKIALEFKAILTEVSSVHADFNPNCTETTNGFKNRKYGSEDDFTFYPQEDSEYIGNSYENDAEEMEFEISKVKSTTDTTPSQESELHTTIQCDLCGSIFKSRTEFRSHQKSHNKSKIFQCDYCPKWFTRAENKTIHVQKHLGIRPFVCEICGQTSTKRQDLIRHMKIHTDEKNHECQRCGRCFKRSGDLSTHLRTHTGARPYGCKMCGKTYTSHSGLRKHVKSHN